MAKKKKIEKLTDIIGTEKPFLLDENGNPDPDEDDLFSIPFFRYGNAGCGRHYNSREKSRMSFRLNEVIKRYLERIKVIVEKQKIKRNIKVYKFLWSKLEEPLCFQPLLENSEENFNGKNIVAYSCTPVNLKIFSIVKKYEEYIARKKHPVYNSKKVPPLQRRAIQIINAISREYYNEYYFMAIWDGSKLNKKYTRRLDKARARRGIEGSQLSHDDFLKIYWDPKKKEAHELMKNVAFELSQPGDYIGFQDFLPSKKDFYESKTFSNSLAEKLGEEGQLHILLPEFITFARNWEPYNAIMPSQKTKLMIDFDKLFGIKRFNEYTINNPISKKVL